MEVRSAAQARRRHNKLLVGRHSSKQKFLLPVVITTIFLLVGLVSSSSVAHHDGYRLEREDVARDAERRILKKTDPPTPSPTAEPDKNDKNNNNNNNKNDNRNDKNKFTPAPTVQPTDDNARNNNKNNNNVVNLANPPQQQPTNPPTEKPTKAPTTKSPTSPPVFTGEAQVEAQVKEGEETEAELVVQEETPKPTNAPTDPPVTAAPVTGAPTTVYPTITPTTSPTEGPSRVPSTMPSFSPTQTPSMVPSSFPTYSPTIPKTGAPIVDWSHLEDLQLLGANDNNDNDNNNDNINNKVSVTFSLHFPDRFRQGYLGEEDITTSTTAKVNVISALQSLFCATGSFEFGRTFPALAKQYKYKDHQLCAFSNNVHDGMSVVSTTTTTTATTTTSNAVASGVGDTPLVSEGNRNLKEKDDQQDGENRMDSNADNNNNNNDIMVVQEVEDEKDDDKKDEKNDKDKQDKNDNDNNQATETQEQQGANEQSTTDAAAAATDTLFLDPTIMVQPPVIQVKEHMNAHKSMAWTTWTVQWSIVRLSLPYLQESWQVVTTSEEEEPDKNSDETVYDYGVTLVQNELTMAMKDNIHHKVFDVILEDLLQETVRASLVGYEMVAFASEMELQEEDHMGYNMTAVDVLNHRKFFKPDISLRIVGGTMLLLTLKAICLLHCLSQRRKRLREKELQQLQTGVGKGPLHSPEGVDEMLKKAALNTKQNALTKMKVQPKDHHKSRSSSSSSSSSNSAHTAGNQTASSGTEDDSGVYDEIPLRNHDDDDVTSTASHDMKIPLPKHLNYKR